MEMGIAVWLLTMWVPLVFLAVTFLIAALSFAWGVRGQRALTAATEQLAEGSTVVPDGRLERACRVMMWAMVFGALASLTAAVTGLSALL